MDTGYGGYGSGYYDAAPAYAAAQDANYYQTPETRSYYAEPQNYDAVLPSSTIPVDPGGAAPIVIAEETVELPNSSAMTGESIGLDGELTPGMVLPDGSTVISVGSP